MPAYCLAGNAALLRANSDVLLQAFSDMIVAGLSRITIVCIGMPRGKRARYDALAG